MRCSHRRKQPRKSGSEPSSLKVMSYEWNIVTPFTLLLQELPKFEPHISLCAHVVKLLQHSRSLALTHAQKASAHSHSPNVCLSYDNRMPVEGSKHISLAVSLNETKPGWPWTTE